MPLLTVSFISQYILSWGYSVVLVMALFGFLMWLAGRALLKPAFTLFWLMLGALAGGLISNMLWSLDNAFFWILGCSVLGAAAGFLGYRVWLAGALAVLLAIMGLWSVVAPAGYSTARPIYASEEKVKQVIKYAVGLKDPAPLPDEAMQVEQGQVIAKHNPWLIRSMKELVGDLFDIWLLWWLLLPWKVKLATSIAVLLGIGLGIWLGLIYPHLAASLGSTLAGMLLMAFAWDTFTESMNNPMAAPGTSQSLLLVVGLGTVTGMVIQDFLFKRELEDQAAQLALAAENEAVEQES